MIWLGHSPQLLYFWLSKIKFMIQSDIMHTCKPGGAVAPMFLDVVQPTRAAVLAWFRVARVRYGYLAQGRGESQRTLARESGLRVWWNLRDRARTGVLAPGHGTRVAGIFPLTVRSDEQSSTAANRTKAC